MLTGSSVALAVIALAIRQGGAGYCLETTLSGGTSGNDFGREVSFDGERIAVGDPNSETVHVFASALGNEWALQGVLKAPTAPDSQFGHGVAIRGDLLVVGALFVESGRGSAFVYEFDAAAQTWQLQDELVGTGLHGFGYFGDRTAVASDDCIVVAAPRRDASTGVVYSFTRTNGRWIESQIIQSPDTVPGELFGHDIAIDGVWMVVGATNRRAAFTYRLEQGLWEYAGELPVVEPGQGFGSAVEIRTSGERVRAIVGAGSAGPDGRAYLFERVDQWSLLSQLIPIAEEAEQFGKAVALLDEGDTVAIGDSRAFAPSFSAGEVTVFSNGQWDQGVVHWSPEPSGGAFFGGTLGGRGRRLIACAYAATEEPGAAFVIRDPMHAVCIDGDLNGDGVVGVPDLLALLASWGDCPAPCPPSCLGDIDADCSIGTSDLLALLAHWG